tara:strand:- start:741 stop:905 length:165 start_codon:yes stop_codon:yes gene_type:complete
MDQLDFTHNEKHQFLSAEPKKGDEDAYCCRVLGCMCPFIFCGIVITGIVFLSML